MKYAVYRKKANPETTWISFFIYSRPVVMYAAASLAVYAGFPSATSHPEL
jgi:hypothetical protein